MAPNNNTPQKGNNNSPLSPGNSPFSPFSPSTQKISNKTKINVTKPSMANPSCETCGSTNDCEEDIDNPGDYYCKSCWEEYSESQQQQQDEKGGEELMKTKNPFAVQKNSDDDVNGDDEKCQGEEEKGMALNLTNISNVNNNGSSSKDDIDSSRSSFPSTSQFLTPRNSSLGTQPPESSEGDESSSLCVSTQPQFQTQALSEVGGLALSSSTQPPLSSSQEALVEFATQADYDTPLESSGDHGSSAELKRGDVPSAEKEVDGGENNDGKIPDGDNKPTETNAIDVKKSLEAVSEKNNTDAQSDVVNIEGNTNKESGDAAESNNEKMNNNAGNDAKSLSGGEMYEKPDIQLDSAQGTSTQRSVIFEATTSAHQNDDDSSDDDDEDGASIRTQEDNFAISKGSGSETGGLLTQAADDDDDEDSEEEDDNNNDTSVKEGDDTIRDKDVHESNGEVKFAQDIIKVHESKAGDQSPMIEAVTTADSQQKGMTLSGLTEPTQPENDKPSVSSPVKSQTLSKPTDDQKEPLMKENATANDLEDDASSAYHGLSEEEKEEEMKDFAAANDEFTEGNQAKEKSSQQEQVPVDKDASTNSPPPKEMQPAKDDNVNDHSTTQQGQDNEPTLGSHSPVDAEMNDDDEDEDEIMEGTGDTIVGSASEGWSLYAGDTQMLPTGPSQPVDSTSPQHQKTDIDTDAKSTTEVSAKQDHPGNAEPPVETADDAFDKETQPLLDKPVVGKETADPATNEHDGGEGDTNACILEEHKAVEDQQNAAFCAIKHTPETGSLPISYPNDESPLKGAPAAIPPVDDARQGDDAMDEDDDGEETQLYSQDLLSPAKSKEDSPQRPSMRSPKNKKTASINNDREKCDGLGKDDNKGNSLGGSKPSKRPAKTLGQTKNGKETKWMSSSRHQEKDDSDDDCSSRSPRLQIPSFKPIRKSPDEEPPTKKPTKNEDNVSDDESDEESLSGNGHNYEADPIIENTQDEHEHEAKRSSAFKRISRSSRDDSSTKFSPRTSERRISKATSNETDRAIKPKVLRYESVTKNDDASEASADSHSSSEAEFNDDGNVDAANNINQYHLSQTDQRVKEQLEEVKAMLPSAEQIRDITSRKELLDEIAKLKKSHKAAIKRLKHEKSEIAHELKNAEETIKKKDQKFKREKSKLVAQLKVAEETITLKDQTIKEKNSLLEEQFKVIEQIKGLQNQASSNAKRPPSSSSAIRTPPPATTTASKKRKKKELPPDSESDSSDDDEEGEEMPISALKNAPATSSSNKRRKKSYGSRQAKVPAMGEERRVSPKVAAVTHRSGDTSSVDTTPASNQTSAKSKDGSVKQSSSKSENDISVLSSDVWKKLQEKGWKYQTGPEPYNKGEFIFFASTFSLNAYHKYYY